MAKGQIAKNDVTDKIRTAFGEDFITIQDNKIYVYGRENGEKIQVAIALTCPKNQVSAAAPSEAPQDWDFSDPTPPPQTKIEISKDEQQNLEDLMKRLGL